MKKISDKTAYDKHFSSHDCEKSEKCFTNVRKEVSCEISALGKLKCIESMIYVQTQFSNKPRLGNQRTLDSNYFRHINALPNCI